MSLSDAKLRTLKPAAKAFKTSDGEGLFIVMNPNGSKLWRMSYRFQGKEKLLAFGAYPREPAPCRSPQAIGRWC